MPFFGMRFVVVDVYVDVYVDVFESSNKIFGTE